MDFQEIVYNKLLEKEISWLDKNVQLVAKEESGKTFLMTFSLIFRFIASEEVKWSTDELLFLEKIYPSFTETIWSKHSICRALLMTKLPQENNKKILTKLGATLGVNAQQDFYKGLFFVENASALTFLIEDGIRTNVTDVFDAIALNNPYAVNFLTDDAWNQLVLKAIFMERPLYKLYRLTKRNNKKLALMLNDYIKERWSAGRTVSPEVWQLMLNYEEKELIETLKKASTSNNELERKAVELILQKKPFNAAIWVAIGQQFNKNKS